LDLKILTNSGKFLVNNCFLALYPNSPTYHLTEKIAFPLNKRTKTKLFEKAKTEFNNSRLSLNQSSFLKSHLSDDSDTDFDYDTASTISGMGSGDIICNFLLFIYFLPS
jgi:hypothetical protein